MKDSPQGLRKCPCLVRPLAGTLRAPLATPAARPVTVTFDSPGAALVTGPCDLPTKWPHWRRRAAAGFCCCCGWGDEVAGGPSRGRVLRERREHPLLFFGGFRF